MNREKNLQQLQDKTKVWDIVVIGGGASGLGVALDAVSRGLSVALLEKADFAKGTSSRSTKLIHGGVRYLAQGQLSLVFEALKERGLLLKNAPHLTHKQSFLIPIYSWWDRIQYSIGLKLYDWMAGSLSLGPSKFISKEETLLRLPHLQTDRLQGAVCYYDGQFDDARLAIHLAQTADELGACLLNYAKVTGLSKDPTGKLIGLKVQDINQKENLQIQAKMIVNATGVFADKILQLDNPSASKTIQPSQGIHLILDLEFLGGTDALMIPKTKDGRVLFGVPWHHKLLLGTTDTIREKAKLEPEALQQEIDFVLETAGTYLTRKPTRTDVQAVFAGLRPLARPEEGSTKTKEISRSHKVIVSPSGLVSPNWREVDHLPKNGRRYGCLFYPYHWPSPPKKQDLYPENSRLDSNPSGRTLGYLWFGCRKNQSPGQPEPQLAGAHPSPVPKYFSRGGLGLRAGNGPHGRRCTFSKNPNAHPGPRSRVGICRNCGPNHGWGTPQGGGLDYHRIT
jgi:glycerol-3-phosphate dehydrogenase